MLHDLLFSFNMCLPIFALLGLGCFLRYKGLFTQAFLDGLSALVYNVLLPANLFLDIAAIDLQQAFAPRYALATVLCLLAQFALAWVAGNLLCPDRRKQSAFTHGSFRGNFAYVGLPLLQNIYNTTAIPSVAMVMAVVLPMYAVQGVVLLRIKERTGRLQPLRILWDVVKNPMILGILAGLPFALFHIPLPAAIGKSLGLLQSACSPMALLVVGGSIQFAAIQGDLPLLLKACGLKLVAVPALWFAVAVVMGLSAEQTVTMTMLAAMPSAVNSFIVTKKLGGDGDTASGIVVLTHALSLLSLTAVIFLLKSGGWI